MTPCPCPYCARKAARRMSPTQTERIRSAMWWLGHGLHRLAGIDPFPERSN